MNKKILIVSGCMVFGVVVAWLSAGSFAELSSSAFRTMRPRVVVPRTDISYVTCKKHESKTENGVDYSVYLSSSKKTYAVTTDTKKTIDVSSLINADYFRQQKIAIGQSDPTRMKYEISYTSSAITLISKIFINNKEFRCPDVILPVSENASETGLATVTPSCKEVLNDLTEEEIQGVTCIGDYSFSVEKPIPTTQIALFSNSDVAFLTHLLAPSVYAYDVPPTTEAPTYHGGTGEKRRCENGVNIQDFMNCKCPNGTYTYEQEEYTVVACTARVGGEKPKKEDIGNIIKKGLTVGRVELPADRDGQGGESGWGFNFSRRF